MSTGSHLSEKEFPGARQIDELCINTIRTLSMDAVQQADSGHPGTPMALAPVVYTLWQRFLRFDPDDPIWPNRDRFVLSNGHASMLLYSLLHLTDVKQVNSAYEVLRESAVTLDDIKHFREAGSKCPGHPEYHVTTGVETTTGPLGQGCATSVGMAMAERWLAQHFNRPGFTLFDYNVYTICGDGDMMEGVASEAASLAGHLMLGNLCWIYDSNRITIEGHTDLAFSENVAARFLAYGWNVIPGVDANDTEALTRALEMFRKVRRTSTTLPQRMVNRSERKRFVWQNATTGGRKTLNSLSRTACASTSAPGSNREAKNSGRLGWNGSKPTGQNIPALPASSHACKSASCRTAGMRAFQFFLPIPRVSPPASLPRKC